MLEVEGSTHEHIIIIIIGHVNCSKESKWAKMPGNPIIGSSESVSKGEVKLHNGDRME